MPTNDSPIQDHFNMLGHKVKDAVTGYEGVATSLSFDLYGCVQVSVTPPVRKDEDGEKYYGKWFDVSRLKITSKRRAMDPPDFFGKTAVAKGMKGAAEKPSMAK